MQTSGEYPFGVDHMFAVCSSMDALPDHKMAQSFNAVQTLVHLVHQSFVLGPGDRQKLEDASLTFPQAWYFLARINVQNLETRGSTNKVGRLASFLIERRFLVATSLMPSRTMETSSTPELAARPPVPLSTKTSTPRSTKSENVSLQATQLSSHRQ